ncbi:MAG: hypothetical protein ABI472_11830 [Ginsengibacter sp.]
MANIIGWLIAYMTMNKWLQNYADKIEQNAIPYLIVGAFIFIAAFLLITARCFKIAVASPIESLRTE